jgi:hypothetical protein
MATQISQRMSSLKQRAVGTFVNYEATEAALNALKNTGFAMAQVSVVGQDGDPDPDAVGANTSDQAKAEEGAMKGTIVGSSVGGLAGLLVGLGAVAIPGVGPIMLAGAAATAIATAISGGVIGGAAGSLVGALTGLDLPADRANAYSDRVSQGEYLVMVEGTEADIALAESILNQHGVRDWYTYDLVVKSDAIPST